MNSLPCFGRLVETNNKSDPFNWDANRIACLSCDVKEECRTASGCFERFNENDTWYHQNYCATCNQIRRCIYQAGIQNIMVGGRIIRSRPAGVPDCFAYYYGLTGNKSHDPREPGCEDMCRSFTDCIKATHSAIEFFSQGYIREEPELGLGKKPQPEELRKALSRFDVIELPDGGESK